MLIVSTQIPPAIEALDEALALADRIRIGLAPFSAQVIARAPSALWLLPDSERMAEYETEKGPR